jgi:hypothetical protein
MLCGSPLSLHLLLEAGLPMARMGQTGEATTTVPSAQLQVALGLVAQACQGEEASRPCTML